MAVLLCMLVFLMGCQGLPLSLQYPDQDQHKEDGTQENVGSKNDSGFDAEVNAGVGADEIHLKSSNVQTNGTDTGLYNLDLFEGDILLKQPGVKSAIKNPKLLWSNGVIVFKIADDVGCPFSRQCHIVMSAIEEYHTKSCVRFKEWTGEEDYVEIFYNTNNSGACWSEVGRSGGEQRLSLGQRCWYLGIVVHELGHSLGFWHEMNRPDRDDHIIIHWVNILQGYSSAFIKYSPSTVDTLGEEFDLKSIMMYDEYAFSKDGKSPTIETRKKAYIGPLWRKTELSESDVRRIHKLYRCNGTNPKSGFPHHFKCDFSQHSCGFRNRGRPMWKWTFVNKNEAYMMAYSIFNGTSGQLASVNFHPLNAINGTKQIGCLSFTYFLRSSTLKVDQEVLPLVTDLGYGTTINLWNSSNVGKWFSVQMNIKLSKPYRLIFELHPRGSGSSATIDNVEITTSKCDLLRNEVSSSSVYSAPINNWIVPDEQFFKPNSTGDSSNIVAA